MGAKGAVEILFKKEIDSAENPQSKAAELEAVGKTYNKLNAFLEAVTKKEQ